jgi:hypothetical protein
LEGKLDHRDTNANHDEADQDVCRVEHNITTITNPAAVRGLLMSKGRFMRLLCSLRCGGSC